MLAGGAAATAALIAWAGYPASMVGVNGAHISNLNPPTLAAVSFGIAQCGLALLLRDRLARLMRRLLAWAAIALVNLSAMTLFLWHQTAFVAVSYGRPAGRPGAGPADRPDGRPVGSRTARLAAGVRDHAVGLVAGVPPGGNSFLTGCRLLCGHRAGLLPFWCCGNRLGLVAGSSKALLGALFGESVARADLIPSGTGLAGGLNLGGLQLFCRFSQLPGSVESANRSVGGVESAERGSNPPDGILGGHHHSVSTTDTGQ